MDFDLKELEKITMRLIKVPERLTEALEREVAGQVNALLSAKARALAPVDTSNLKNNIDTDGFAYRTDDGVVMGITSHANYSVYVEYGTGHKGDPSVPHTTKKSWVYYDEDGEKRIGRPRAPVPYMRTALYDNKDNVKRIIQGKAKEVIQHD